MDNGANEKDLKGFAGNLDKLVPELINDPIYGSGRIQKGSKLKDLGNLKSGDAQGEEQYKWWNSETQSNWWDGFIRNAILVNDLDGLKKVREYISRILATQDTDGYLGIYSAELRYHFNSENGELWSKTTLLRGLFAYFEYTRDPKVWNAIDYAVENLMKNYPAGNSSPFNSGTGFNGGVSHGLSFTDVLEKMYEWTGDKKYLQYSYFLYQDYSSTSQSESDAQQKNIEDPAYKMKSHGVHSYEFLRPLVMACLYSQDKNLLKDLSTYVERIKYSTTPTGGAIGDEWIGGRKADASATGYEYCSLHELLNSYCLLFKYSGNASSAEEIERIFYNAAQGARNPDYSCIAYLKTDNSYEMNGTKNGESEPGRNQTRYKYSPVHQDVAVCCVPNAARISPCFVQNMWMQGPDSSLMATVLGPCILQTLINKDSVIISEETTYPYQNSFCFKIHTKESLTLTLRIRKPEWEKGILTGEVYALENGFITIRRKFKKEDSVNISFKAEVKLLTLDERQRYFSYGPLIYAHPIPAVEKDGHKYSNEFTDRFYKPENLVLYDYINENKAEFKDDKILVLLKNRTSSTIDPVTLVPLAKTILRQAAF